MEIKEGSAKIYYKKEWLNRLSSKLEVFYNPIMQINRDLTILIIKSYYIITGKKVDFLDAMSGTGIRSIRILKEARECVRNITINDISKSAIDHIKKNLKLNDIPLSDVELTREDCRILMYKKRFNFIDIDPFGPPIGFIEPAVVSLRNKGILAVTATDISALSGVKVGACRRKYRCHSRRTDFYKEFGIRNLIRYVIEEASQFEIAMIPIFGYYYKHHYRVFFLKSVKKTDLNRLLENINHVSYCVKCHYKSSSDDICKICGNKLLTIGPIYTDRMYNVDYLKVMIQLSKEFNKETRKILERIYNGDAKLGDIWYYYEIPELARVQKVSEIPKIGKILEKYNGVRTHFSETGIKCREYPFI